MEEDKVYKVIKIREEIPAEWNFLCKDWSRKSSDPV